MCIVIRESERNLCYSLVFFVSLVFMECLVVGIWFDVFLRSGVLFVNCCFGGGVGFEYLR